MREETVSMQGSWMPCVILLLENKVSLAFWAHPRLIDRVLLNALALRPLLVFVMRSPFGWQSGCLSSMGGPAGMGRNARIRECANGERSSEVLECVRQAVFRATPLLRRQKKAVASGSYRTPAFLACDVTRYTPLPRPLVRRAPVHPLAGSFPWSRADLLLASCSRLPVNARNNISSNVEDC